MATIPIELLRPHKNQQVILDDTSRFRVVACGRRFGKTELAKHECVIRLLHGQHIWYCTPTNRLAKKVFRKIADTLKYVPNQYVNYSDQRIELPNGAWLEAVSLQEPDNLRGEGLDFVVVDEAAFVRDGIWDSVLRPMLATDRGSALFPSSPYGRNWFWQIYGLGLDPLQADWSSYHYTSADGGLIDHDELADIERGTPERVFREEYLAEFLEDSGSVFRNVDAAATAPAQAVRENGKRYVMGVDWGRAQDYTVAVVIDCNTQTMVDCARFNQIGYSLQRGYIANMQAKWVCSVILAEANAMGVPNIEELQKAGLPVRGFHTTAQSKAPLIESLAVAIERGDLQILNDSVLLNELKAYELQRLPSGTFRYNAPSGGHDDTVIATALAWEASQLADKRAVRLVSYRDNRKTW